MTHQSHRHRNRAAVRGADCMTYASPHRAHTRALSEKHGTAPIFSVIAGPVMGRLHLLGELDVAGTQRLAGAITAILAGRPPEVLVDLGRLRFIDASGVGLLVGLRDELAAYGAPLRIVNADAWIGRVFSLCGLSAMLSSPAAS